MNQFAPPTLPTKTEVEVEPKTRWKPVVVIAAVIALAAGGAWLIGEKQADNREEELRRNARNFGG